MKYISWLILFSFFAVSVKAQTGDPLFEARIFDKFYAKFALDEKPNVLADTNLIAIWKMKEDVDEHNYFVVERYSPYIFASTYMNRGGSNRTYENFVMFFSKIGDVTFLNVRYDDYETNASGYFFLKVTDSSGSGWNLNLSLVTDTTLKNIVNREALREYISRNMNNPQFYGKTVHFDKKLPLMYCK